MQLLCQQQALLPSARRQLCNPGKRQRFSHACCRAVQAADAQLTQILSWATTNSVQTDKVTVAQDLATDASVIVAAKDIAAGDAIISVPDSSWLGAAAAQQSSIGRYIASLEPWLQLALVLLAERAAPGSRLRSYISSLPSQLDSPVFWSEKELQLLQGTQLLESVMGYKQFFSEQYQQLDEQLFSPNRSAFPADAFNYSSFVWAVATVRSKLHAPLDSDPVALVPLADWLPHRRSANSTWRLKSAGLFGKGKVLTVEATKAVRKGEALSMDYGPEKLDNAVLLDHGIMDASNPKVARHGDNRAMGFVIMGLPLKGCGNPQVIAACDLQRIVRRTQQLMDKRSINVG
eukprot:GHUV01014605.1.p1 GENE.GHUV01014605.1~~GHUV01014605.1.p1  ORF type:complete len:347 (+),score=91.08 GHUV01014605.1:276-1316(+)